MGKPRKRYPSQEKAAILREHLIDRVPVSDLCDKHGISPTLFYQWQRTDPSHNVTSLTADFGLLNQ